MNPNYFKLTDTQKIASLKFHKETFAKSRVRHPSWVDLFCFPVHDQLASFHYLRTFLPLLKLILIYCANQIHLLTFCVKALLKNSCLMILPFEFAVIALFVQMIIYIGRTFLHDFHPPPKKLILYHLYFYERYKMWSQQIKKLLHCL